jgi:hypothetical protein
VGRAARRRWNNKMKEVLEEKKSKCKEYTEEGGRHNQISGKENL